jgi:hypothetical protein
MGEAILFVPLFREAIPDLRHTVPYRRSSTRADIACTMLEMRRADVFGDGKLSSGEAAKGIRAEFAILGKAGQGVRCLWKIGSILELVESWPLNGDEYLQV